MNRKLSKIEKRENRAYFASGLSHWFYPGERLYSTGRIRAACGRMIHARNESNLQNPTCITCNQAMKEFNKISDEIIGE